MAQNPYISENHNSELDLARLLLIFHIFQRNDKQVQFRIVIFTYGVWIDLGHQLFHQHMDNDLVEAITALMRATILPL